MSRKQRTSAQYDKGWDDYQSGKYFNPAMPKAWQDGYRSAYENELYQDYYADIYASLASMLIYNME